MMMPDHRVTFLLACAALAGCFTEPDDLSTPDDDGESSSSSTDGGQSETSLSSSSTSSSSATSIDPPDESSGDASTGSDDSSGSTGEPNDGLLLWHAWDGDYIDTISGQEGIPTGDASVNTSALELHGAGTVDVSYFSAAYRSTLTSMTISIRYFANNGTGQRTLVAMGDNGEAITNNTHQVRILDNVFELMTETGDGENHIVQLGPTPSFAAGAWHTVTFVFDGDVVTTCSDGTLLSEVEYVPAQTQAQKLFVGGTWITGEGLDGFVDDLRIWNVPRSSECE